MSADDDRPLEVTYEIPPRLRVGVYANTARISFSAFEFTLDWAVIEQEGGDLDDGSRVAIVCSRVRIPVSLVFDVLQGINRAMTYYESRYGEIQEARRMKDDERRPYIPVQKVAYSTARRRAIPKVAYSTAQRRDIPRAVPPFDPAPDDEK